MVWWWRLYTRPGCTTCTGNSNPSFCSHQLIVTYFCICNHLIFSFQSLNHTKSSKDIPIYGVSKVSAHSAGTHWAYWFINQSLLPSHKQNVTQLMQHGSPFSLSTTGIFPNQAQAISPMVCRWGLGTRLGYTACIIDDFGPKPPDTMVREQNLT
jgi:hypothetical protein